MTSDRTTPGSGHGSVQEPHGGELKVPYSQRVRRRAREGLSGRQLPELEPLPTAALRHRAAVERRVLPLDGFLSRVEYDSVLAKMRLRSGLIWPIPITLDVTSEFASSLKEGDRIALRDPEGVLIATMEISDIWEPDKAYEARSVFGTGTRYHSGVYFLQHRTGPMYLGGTLRGVEPPMHYDFKILRDSPSELRGRFRSSAGARSWRSRRATRCIVPTRNYAARSTRDRGQPAVCNRSSA